MRCASSIPPRNVDSQERHSAAARGGSHAGVRVPARRDNEAVVAGRDDSSIAAEDPLRRRTADKQAGGGRGGGRGGRCVGVKDEEFRPKRRFKVLGNMFEIDAKYELIKSIGHGAYGVVISAVNKETGQKVAIKKITRAFDDLVDAKRILREITLLRKFGHDNIISIVDILVPPSSEEFEDVYIVSDLMETDLHRIINSGQDLSLDHVQYFIYQILRALKYMHSSNVLHRDLKPSNLLLNSNCDLKVCDLGLARDTESGCRELTEYVVTRWYRAPEIMLACQEYSKAIDVWSVGCIFAELMLRRPFFPGDNYLDQLMIICDKLGKPKEDELDFVSTEKARRFIMNLSETTPRSLRDQFPATASDSALDLLSKMLEFHPGKRISVKEALRHPFIQNLHAAKDEPIADFEFCFGFEEEEPTKHRLQELMWEEMRRYHPEQGAWKGKPSPSAARSGSSSAALATPSNSRTPSSLGEEYRQSPAKMADGKTTPVAPFGRSPSKTTETTAASPASGEKTVFERIPIAGRDSASAGLPDDSQADTPAGRGAHPSLEDMETRGLSRSRLAPRTAAAMTAPAGSPDDGITSMGAVVSTSHSPCSAPGAALPGVSVAAASRARAEVTCSAAAVATPGESTAEAVEEVTRVAAAQGEVDWGRSSSALFESHNPTRAVTPPHSTAPLPRTEEDGDTSVPSVYSSSSNEPASTLRGDGRARMRATARIRADKGCRTTATSNNSNTAQRSGYHGIGGASATRPGETSLPTTRGAIKRRRMAMATTPDCRQGASSATGGLAQHDMTEVAEVATAAAAGSVAGFKRTTRNGCCQTETASAVMMSGGPDRAYQGAPADGASAEFLSKAGIGEDVPSQVPHMFGKRKMVGDNHTNAGGDVEIVAS